jgi:putative ABC transport system ATP-binding protein
MEVQAAPIALKSRVPSLGDPGGPKNIIVRDVYLARADNRFARIPDFNAASGESVALVGPSGSGKTTALMALAAIHPPESGEIRIQGDDPWSFGKRARDGFRGRRIGLIFQSFHLVDALSVAANIRLASKCAGHPVNDDGHLDMLLERLGLASIRNKRADRISHGQAQRVAVARALINKPAVILADEPTSALDDANTVALLSLLKDCAAMEGAALIVATHDRRALEAVDRVVAMEAA